MIDVIKYNGADITEDVDIISCYHDMYASEKVDNIHITFDDSDGKWDGWGALPDDEIEIEYEGIKTGILFVLTTNKSNGFFEIVATSAPSSFSDKKNKAWQKIKLKKICEEIANDHGLSLKTYGLKDIQYNYLIQSNESDGKFLNGLTKLEGCGFLIYDKTLVVYQEKYMEEQDALEVLEFDDESDYEYTDKKSMLYGSCKIEQGEYAGEYLAQNGSEKTYIPPLDFVVNSKSDAARYAKNLLRYVNKNTATGIVYTPILSGYTPASVAKIATEKASSWNGKIFITHVRNDYIEETSKIFFRRVIEGDY